MKNLFLLFVLSLVFVQNIQASPNEVYTFSGSWYTHGPDEFNQAMFPIIHARVEVYNRRTTGDVLICTA